MPADTPTPAAGERPMCEHCGKRPATCIGHYDAMDFDAYACDECCAHGCEDGHCELLESRDAR